MLSDCVPSSVYARETVAGFLQRTPVSEILKSHAWLRQELILAVARASEMPEDSACGTAEVISDRCSALVESIGANYSDRGSTDTARMDAFAFRRLGTSAW